MRHAGQTIQSTHAAIRWEPGRTEDEKQEELEHYDEMGVPRGRLAVTMDLVTDAMALVGQQASIVRARVAPLGGEHPDHHGKFD